MDKRERKEQIREEMCLLQKLYKELQTWEVSSIGAWAVAAILLSIGTLPFLIPYQEYGTGQSDQTMCVVILYLLWFGLIMYMNPYMTLTEGQKKKSIVGKLQYLPIYRRSILFFQLKKLLRMVLLLGAVQLVGQCGITAIICRRLELCNLLFPVVAGMLVPGAASGLCITFSVLFAKNSK